MNFRKWGIRVATGLFLLVLSIAIFIEVKKEDLAYLVSVKLNSNIQGEFNYESVQVSFLRTFPHIELHFKEGQLFNATDEIALLSSPDFSVRFDIWGLLPMRQGYTVDRISFSNPKVNLIKKTNGSYNFNIWDPNYESNNHKELNFRINHIRIRNLNLNYMDEGKESIVQIDSFLLDGSLLYKNGVIHLKNVLEGQLMIHPGSLYPPYNIYVNGNNFMTIDNDFTRIHIDESLFVINDLPIEINGDISNNMDVMNYVFDLNSPASDVKHLLSVFPLFFKENYEDLISEGQFEINGKIEGSSLSDYPIFDINIRMGGRGIRYPDLPGQINSCSFLMSAINDRSDQVFTEIKLTNLNVQIGESFLSGSIELFSNDDSISHILMNTNLNFQDISDALPLTSIQKLTGILKTQIDLSTRLFPFTNNSPEIIDSKINIILSDLYLLRRNSSSPLSLANGQVIQEGSLMEYSFGDIQYGHSIDMDAKGIISNPISSWFTQELIRGESTVHARLIDFSVFESDSSTANARNYDLPAIDIDFIVKSDSILYGAYILEDSDLEGSISNDHLNFQFDSKVNQNAFSGKAFLNNIIGYSFNEEILSGEVYLTSVNTNWDRILDVDVDSASTSGEHLIPDDLALRINYDMTNSAYHSIDLNRISGNAKIDSDTLFFESEVKLFGGKVRVQGALVDSEQMSPSVDINFDMTKLLFSETAKQSPLFTQLLPIAPFVIGNYNGVISWKSNLNDDYLPRLETLTSYGYIETSNGQLNGFLPLDTLLSFISGLSNRLTWDIADTKNWFIIEDGRVHIEEFNIRHNNIAVQISGAHSFNQDMDYEVLTTLPSNFINPEIILEEIPALQNSKGLLDSFTGSSTITLRWRLSGKVTHPKFRLEDINFTKSSESQLEDIQDKTQIRIDSLNSIIMDSLDHLEKQVEEQVGIFLDSLQSEFKKKKEETETQIFDSLLIHNLDSLKAKIGDIILRKKLKIPFRINN